MFLLVGVVGLSFLHASATAKAVNTATNLAALLLFGLAGHVLWGLGLAMAGSNLLGSQVGARLAIAAAAPGSGGSSSSWSPRWCSAGLRRARVNAVRPGTAVTTMFEA